MSITIPNKWRPMAHQRKLYNSFGHKKDFQRASVVWHRRAGKDSTALNITAREMFKRPGVYWHLFPEQAQARKAIWNGVNRAGMRILNQVFPGFSVCSRVRGGQQGVIQRLSNQEMLIETTNGAIWQMAGSDNFDSLVGSNPVGVVFSEWALANPESWDYIRPILLENGGWALFITCVAPDTLVLSSEGMREIGEILDGTELGYNDHAGSYFGLGGFHDAVESYRGPKQACLKITTAKGYSLTCTPVHPIWTGTEWRRAAEWSRGQLMPIQLDQGVFGDYVPSSLPVFGTHGHNNPIPFGVDEDLYYFLGLVIAEGSWTKTVVNISNPDAEIIEFLASYGFKNYGGPCNESANSNLAALVDWFGIKHRARNKDLPEKVRTAPKWAVRELLRGLFDGDGCARLNGAVQFDSVSERLVDQVQAMLLNFGIVSSKSQYDTKPSELVKVSSHCYRLYISGHMAARFYDRVGFRLTRKQERRANLSRRQVRQRQDVFHILPGSVAPEYWSGLNEGAAMRQAERGTLSWCTIERLNSKRHHPLWERILGDGFHYDRVVSIENVESEVFDFVIPETHSFFSNGFVSHNTPRGRNHAYETHMMSQGNDDWFSQRLTIEDTGILTAEDMAREREAGMSEAKILQEYYTDFQAETDEQFISSESVSRCRKMEAHSTIGDPLIIGVDVARHGDDKSVIYFRRGRDARSIEPLVYSKLDTMQLAARVSEEMDKHVPDGVFIDAGGMGWGVVDRLRQMNRDVVAVDFGRKSDRYVEGCGKANNKRSEMWVTMRKALDEGTAIPNDDRIAFELLSPNYTHDADNRIVLESKKDMKKRGLRSPDIADALALTFAYPCNGGSIKAKEEQRADEEYDPFGW